MEKRFIYGLASEWNANKVANEAKFANSIVFIKNDGWNGTTNTKGDAIFAQGAYFEMNNAKDVENIINSYLSEGKNIEIAVDEENSKLVIGAVSLSSIDKLAEADKTKLVEAQAVKDALTTPVNLTLTLNEGVASFAETFGTLEGGEKIATATTAVLKQGDYISFTNDGGLKISVDKTSLVTDLETDLNYSDGNVITVDNTNRTINHNEVAETTKETGTAINPTSDAKSFDIKSYGFDTYGHIASETTTTVTLPDNAFKNDNTTYDLDVTANATDGVDVNLKGNDDSIDTVTFVGGSNVTVALNAGGQVEISSSFENDNTTYDGKEAIKVAQPEGESTTGEISLKIDETDLFLSQTNDGLKANIEVAYDSTTNYIYLKGVGETDKTVGFDASAFVKDSFVESVSYVDADDQGNTGKFLKFVFVVVDQDEQEEFEKTTTTTYVDVTDLINTIYDVEGDTATYSVVEESTKDDGTVLFTVKNTLGTIARDNDKNEITVSKEGLATVTDIKDVLETIGSDLDAVKAEGANKDEIAVVTGITQANGKITAVDSGLAATKAYVDGAIDGLDSDIQTKLNATNNVASGEADGSNDQMFTKIVIIDGKLSTEHCAAANVDKAKLVDYTTTSTQNYVGITTNDTIAQAFAKLEEAWDWGTIE